jgi:hypothetical protein
MPDDDATYDDAVEIERHPGRKHTRAEFRALMADLRRIYKRGDERELMLILRRYGITDEDARFSEIVKLFHALQGGKT